MQPVWFALLPIVLVSTYHCMNVKLLVMGVTAALNDKRDLELKTACLLLILAHKED